MVAGLGPADIEAIKQSNLIINEILAKLKKNNAINPDYKTAFNKLDKLLLYSDACAQSLMSFQNAITKDNYTNFVVLKNDLAKHKISENQILNAYGALIFNQFLLLYAHLGNILVCVLTGAEYKDKRQRKQKIKGTEALGKLLDAIESLTGNDLSKIIDNELRNALAHGWYHFENGDTVVYFTDGTLANKKSIALGELYIKQRKVWHFVATWVWQLQKGI